MITSHPKRVRRMVPIIAERKQRRQSIYRIATAMKISYLTVKTICEEQDLVDAADFALLLDSAFQYGLIEWAGCDCDGSGVNVERALEILADARAQGFIPARELASPSNQE